MIFNEDVSLRRARKADLPAVEAILESNKLPVEGVGKYIESFWLAMSGGRVSGCAGLETYGNVGLLRSVAVLRTRREEGIGTMLVESVIREARSQGVTGVFLLTETGTQYFEAFGFRPLTLAQAPGALLASEEFRGVCPATAILMGLSLA